MKKDHKFIRNFFITVVILLTTTFFLNNLIDPLWYNNGNKLTKVNYSWDERSQILNRFFKIIQTEKIDCLIFGSSTSTVLNVKKIQKYKCVNFSFSGGALDEYEAILIFIKKYVDPKIIIIEVNFNLDKKNILGNNLPNYINLKNGEYNKRINYFKDYTSLKALIFSLKTLINKPDLLNVYDENFEPYVLKDKAKIYNKFIDLPISIKEEKDFNFYSNSKTYQSLKKLYPSAKFIGFIHPFHPKNAIAFYKLKKTNKYLKQAYETSKNFDNFYDFAIPSKINFNKENTYDGSHYYPHIYDLVIDRIFKQKKNNYGIVLSEKERYFKQYFKAIKEFN